MKTTLLPILVGLLTIASCAEPTKKQPFVTGKAIAIDSTITANIDTAYVAYLSSKRTLIDSLLQVKIGEVAVDMTVGQPESVLSNWASDLFLTMASNETGMPIDVAIVNIGGLRCDVPKGDITFKGIFELMPFENELTVLYLQGSDLINLCQSIAKKGGEGVAGLRMQIKDKKAVNITVNGAKIETDRLYTVATNNYLAEGNDNLTELALYKKKVDTGLKIRDAFIRFIQTETAQNRPIQAKLDGRITIVNE